MADNADFNHARRFFGLAYAFSHPRLAGSSAFAVTPLGAPVTCAPAAALIHSPPSRAVRFLGRCLLAGLQLADSD